jgi:protein regulator of cytokinesis 1
MKELVLKKMTELEEIYKSVHMDIDSDHEWQILTDLIDSGLLLSHAFFPEENHN